jgi:hypothetical protein
MTTKQDVLKWAELLNGAISNVAQRVKQDKFNVMFQQGMQPQQNTQWNAPPPMRGINPGVQGALNAPLPQTTTTQPSMLQVLNQIVSQNPEMAQQAQPLLKHQYDTAVAATAPWMNTPRGGMQTHAITGQTIENPMESAPPAQKNAYKLETGKTKNEGGIFYKEVIAANPTTQEPLPGAKPRWEAWTQETKPRMNIGLQEKRLVKSYQDSFNRDPAIKTYKDQGMSLAAVNGIIQEAKKGNQVSASALGVKMAKTMGEVGMLSESDVTRYVQAKAIDRSTADKLNKWIKGVPTDATLNDIQQIANVMRTRFTEQIQPIISSYAQQMSTGIGITEDEAINYLASERLLGIEKQGDGSKPQGKGVTQERQIVKTGKTKDGRKVIQYSDGKIEYQN